MFWSSPSADLDITKFLIFISFCVAGFLFYKRRNLLLSLTVFSVLSNIVAYLLIYTRSRIFAVYDMHGVADFAQKPWPLINLALLAVVVTLYFKNKKVLKK